jgi:hypothetical protein
MQSDNARRAVGGRPSRRTESEWRGERERQRVSREVESGWRVCERSPFRCQALVHSPIPLAATRGESSHDTHQQKYLNQTHLKFLKNMHIGIPIGNQQLLPLALPSSSNERARKGVVIMCASVSADRFHGSRMNHGPLRKAPFPSRHGLASPQYARTHYSHHLARVASRRCRSATARLL